MRSLILLIGLGFLMAACGSSDSGASNGGKNLSEKKAILTGKDWRVAVELIKPMEDTLGLVGRQTEVFANSMNQLQFATLTFYPDSNLSVNLNNGRNRIAGRWMFDDSGKDLFLSFTVAQPLPHKIEYMSEDSIVLGMNKEIGIIFPKILVPVSESMGLEKETTPPVDTTTAPGQE